MNLLTFDYSMSGDSAPRASALRGWCLLFTSLDSALGSAEVESLLGQMAVMVGDKSVDVRSAAGEVVALLCRCGRLGDKVVSDPALMNSW